MTKGSFAKTEWDRLVDLLQIRTASNRTKQEKDVQDRLRKATDQNEFPPAHYDDEPSDIPSVSTKNTKHKGNKRGGAKRARDPEVGGDLRTNGVQSHECALLEQLFAFFVALGMK